AVEWRPTGSRARACSAVTVPAPAAWRRGTRRATRGGAGPPVVVGGAAWGAVVIRVPSRGGELVDDHPRGRGGDLSSPRGRVRGAADALPGAPPSYRGMTGPPGPASISGSRG